MKVQETTASLPDVISLDDLPLIASLTSEQLEALAEETRREFTCPQDPRFPLSVNSLGIITQAAAKYGFKCYHAHTEQDWLELGNAENPLDQGQRAVAVTNYRYLHVVYDDSRPKEQLNFGLAHDCKHVIHDSLFIAKLPKVNQGLLSLEMPPNLETQASTFARCLLMPRETFWKTAYPPIRAIVEKHKRGASIEENRKGLRTVLLNLAYQFVVTPKTAALRLKDINCFGSRQWQEKLIELTKDLHPYFSRHSQF